MQKFLKLSIITGGKSQDKPIKELHDLVFELQKNPSLQDNLFELMGNPEIANMISDPNKMGPILDLLDKMDPALLRELPDHYQEMLIRGMI